MVNKTIKNHKYTRTQWAGFECPECKEDSTSLNGGLADTPSGFGQWLKCYACGFESPVFETKKSLAEEYGYDIQPERLKEHSLKVSNRVFDLVINEFYAVISWKDEVDDDTKDGYRVGDTVSFENESGYKSEAFVIDKIINNPDDFATGFSWNDVFYMMSEVARIEKEKEVEDLLNNGYLIAIFVEKGEK